MLVRHVVLTRCIIKLLCKHIQNPAECIVESYVGYVHERTQEPMNGFPPNLILQELG